MNAILRYKTYFIIFFLIGTIVYFPIFFNGFVWDDLPFIINNPQVHRFDFHNLLGPNMFDSGPFYRPIPAIYFAAVYSLFTTQAFFYHALQLFLHIICTYLLFLCLRHFFKNNIALFLALIFLIHPINVESVAYIGSSQSELYFIPGITALLLSMKRQLSPSRLVLIVGLLLIAVMVKETGFLFVLLILIYRYLFRLNKIKQFLISTIFMLIIYFLLRIFVGEVTYQMGEYIPIAGLSFWERLFNIPAMIMYYLKTFIFPLQLAVWQVWIIKAPTFQNFVIPLIQSCTFFIVVFYIAYFLYKKNAERYSYTVNQHKYKLTQENSLFDTFIFFLIWFVIGLCMLLQLVPLDMTVADRWFYFPIIGLLGLIGTGLQMTRRHKTIYIPVLLILVCVLSARTFIRTFDYRNNLTLYAHDINVEPENHFLICHIANALYYQKKFNDALIKAKECASLSPSLPSFQSLGLMYLKTGKYTEAVSAYIRAIRIYNFTPESDLKPPPGMISKDDAMLDDIYVNLAITYLHLHRPEDTIELINKKALNKFPLDPRLYYHLAIAEYMLKNNQEALEAITKSRKLYTDENTEYIYFRLKNNLPLDVRLI